jgi:trk system potassium uptake protein TrkA
MNLFPDRRIQSGNIVVAGLSTFTRSLVDRLADRVEGRVYFVVPDGDEAMEMSLTGTVIAVQGDITDTAVLDQLDLDRCDAFIAGSRDGEANVLAALYAKQQGVQRVYARIFEAKLTSMLSSLGVAALQTSHTAAAFTALGLLKPLVAELVAISPEKGRFQLEEIPVSSYPELVGARLGDLKGEHLHVIAVAQEGDIRLSSTTVVKPEATLIIIYDSEILKHLRPALRRIAKAPGS